MEFTVAGHLGAVQRSLSTRTREGRPMRVLAVSRRFDVASEELWDALTTPERIQVWLGPTSGDLGVGGRFDIEDNASGDPDQARAAAERTLAFYTGSDGPEA